MVKVKDLATIKANYTSGASVATERYKAGVQGTTDWQSKATSESAEANYAENTQKAISNKTRQKALQKVSDSTWKDRAVNVGGSRIADGMRKSADKMAQGYAPIKSALESLSLPNKSTDPMGNIDNRLKPVVQAEIDAKNAQLGI